MESCLLGRRATPVQPTARRSAHALSSWENPKVTDQQPDAEEDDLGIGRLLGFAIALSVASALVIVVGVVSALVREQTAVEVFLLSSILAGFSVGAGWVFAELSTRSKEKRERSQKAATAREKQQEIERNALSSVRRIFNVMQGFGRIEALAADALAIDGSTAADKYERTTVFRIIGEHASTHRTQAADSIQDWRYFAPEVIDAEIHRVEQLTQPALED